MIPEVRKISQIPPDQSVICIVSGNSIPPFLTLSKSEKEYASKRLAEKDDHVFINSYYKCTYIVRIKDDLPDGRCKEELSC